MASTSHSTGLARRVRRSVAWHRFKEYVNGALWVLPTAAALLALAAGYVMSQISHDPDSLVDRLRQVFNVTLEGITDRYYRTISSSAQKSKDAFFASWGADWPSGSTVLPPLLDGRINLTEFSSNQDYGWYNSDAVNAAIDAAYLIPDTAAREKAWGDIDQMISKDGAVVPLTSQEFTYVRGSIIKGYSENQLFGGFPDLATIAVK